MWMVPFLPGVPVEGRVGDWRGTSAFRGITVVDAGWKLGGLGYYVDPQGGRVWRPAVMTAAECQYWKVRSV